MTTLRLAGLTRSFEDYLAVDDVSLDVADGEFLTPAQLLHFLSLLQWELLLLSPMSPYQ